jgi:hypothetical protein
LKGIGFDWLAPSNAKVTRHFLCKLTRHNLLIRQNLNYSYFCSLFLCLTFDSLFSWLFFSKNVRGMLLAWLAVDDCVNAVYMDSTTKYKTWLTATVTKIVSYDVDEGMQLGISRVKCCFTRGIFRSAPLGAHWKRNVRFWYHVRCSVYWKLHASMLGFGARFKVVLMHGAWLLLACW